MCYYVCMYVFVRFQNYKGLERYLKFSTQYKCTVAATPFNDNPPGWPMDSGIGNAKKMMEKK